MHAAVDHSLRYPDQVMSAPTVVVLGIGSELRLAVLSDELQGDLDLEVTRFIEPDLPAALLDQRRGQLTAIALVAEPNLRELRRLSLLFREEVKR